MIEREPQLREDELRALYQDMLPEGIVLERRLASNVRFGDLFLAKDSRFGARRAALRSVRFVPPHEPGEDEDAWSDWLAWREAFLEKMAEFAGLEIPHFAAPLDVAKHALGRVYVVSPYHRQSVRELIDANQNLGNPQTSCSIVEETLSALAGLHAQGLTHADVKAENIFVERLSNGDGVPVTWLGDPAEGVLQVCSRNRLHDPQRGRYYPAHAIGQPSRKSDLHALASVACDLALPRPEEQSEHASPTSSAEELWTTYRRLVQPEAPGGAWRAKLRLLLGDVDSLSRQRLDMMIATLLGQPLVDNMWRRLTRRLHSSDIGRPEDAVNAMFRFRRQERYASASALRLFTVGLLGLVVLLIALALVFAQAKRPKSALESEKEHADKDQPVFQGPEDDVSGQPRNTQVHLDTVKADVNAIKTGIDAIKADIESMVRSKIPPGRADSIAESDARSKAKGAWRAAFGRSTPGKTSTGYDKKRAQSLYEQWSQKAPDVATAIREWKQGTNGSGGLDELLRRGKPWLEAKSDAALIRLCNEAVADPWEKLDEAERRLEELLAAAERWEKCASLGVDLKEVIDTQPREDVKTILKTWNEKMLLTTQWTLRLGVGRTAEGAKLDKPSRIIRIDAASQTSNKHDWNLGPKALRGCESSFEYGKAGPELRDMSFQWRWGEERKPIQLVVEQDTYWSATLITEAFDGPLAIWKLDQAGSVKSSDGKTTLSFRVVDCPGPPRGWNVPHDVAKKAAKAAKKILPNKRTP